MIYGRFLFMGVGLIAAMAVAAFSQVDLSAKCRCDQSRAGARKAARADNRCAKRASRGRGAGSYSYQYQYNAAPSPGGNPYGVDGVQLVGSTAGAQHPRFGATGIDERGRSYIVTYAESRAGGHVEQRCFGNSCTTIFVPATPAPKSTEQASKAPAVGAAEKPVADSQDQEPAGETPPPLPQEETATSEPEPKEPELTAAADVYSQDSSGRIWRTSVEGKKTLILVLDDEIRPIENLPPPEPTREFMRFSDFKKVTDLWKSWSGVINRDQGASDAPQFDSDAASKAWAPATADTEPQKPAIELFAGHDTADPPELSE